MSKEYICIAPSKEQFNILGESLGMSGKRALYYHTDIGRTRIYRSKYPKALCFNKKLKLLKYKSLKYAQKICDLINTNYGDNFKPFELKK